MRVLVSGARGMLGSDVALELSKCGHDVVAADREQLDISRPDAVAQIPGGTFGTLDWCVNCAAYTAVDQAEASPDEAIAVNALGAGYLASACAIAGVRLLHVGTDFVFDGSNTRPYREDDPPAPLGIYGQTKLEGEEAVLASSPMAVVVRTAWLFGPNGRSFPRTMIEAWKAGKNLRVVADQRGSPTYTGHLASVLCAAMGANLPGGIYHAAGPSEMTWHDLATLAIGTYEREILGRTTIPQIEAISTEQYPTPARRPKYSVLDSSKLQSMGISAMPPIEKAMAEFCRRLYAA